MTEQSDFHTLPGQRQLFLDSYGVAGRENLRVTVHQPVKKGAVLRPATELGEDAIQTRSAPAWDPEARLFRLWYIGGPAGAHGLAGYAESRDGIEWAKPILRQVEVNGARENNYVTVAETRSRPDCVLRDALDPDPARRYKGLSLVAGGAQPVASDGVSWRLLEVRIIPSSDEFNLSFDTAGRRFIATVKQRGPHGRAVALSTSGDFERWTAPELIFHADDRDQELARAAIEQRLADPTLQQPLYNIPADYHADIYNMGVFRYEGLYIGLPAVFHQTGKIPTGNQDGFHLVQLACSRDLCRWERAGERQPFIGPSPAASGAYDTTQILPPSFPVARGDELWFYYTGIKYRAGHEEETDRGGICRAVLRRDGFVSLDAGDEEGWVLTRPFLFPDGDLHLNADAGRGRVVVQVRDESGAALPGWDPSWPLRGDHLDAVAHLPGRRWRDLAGRKVCLRIRLLQAQLYSYWVQ